MRSSIDDHTRDDILKVVERSLRKSGPVAKAYRARGAINERACLGDQWATVSWQNGARVNTEDLWFDDEGVPRIVVNHLQNISITWTSLLTENRPSAKAFPATQAPDDLFRADIANKVIDFFVAEEDTATKIHQATMYACHHGTAGLKIIYNPTKDAIQWAPLTIFNYYIDLTPNWQDARWVIFEDFVTMDEAEELFEEYGIDRDPREEKYRNGANEECEGVRRMEVWLRPNRRFKQGLYACLIDGEVTEEMDYPYVVENDSSEPEYLLPLVLTKVRTVRDSAYGHTPLSDCMPLQRGLNETNARILKVLRRHNPSLILPKRVALEYNEEEGGIIEVGDSDMPHADKIRYTEPPVITPAFFNYRDYWRQSILEVMGVNEVTAGDRTRSISGKAIENIVALDKQKNADASKSLEAMILAAWRLTLALVQLFYTSERTIHITDDTGAGALTFSGADIQGVDIRLEPGSEIDRKGDAMAAKEDERAQAGLPGEDARRAGAFRESLSHEAAQQICKDWIAGKNIELNADDLNLDALAEVVDQERATALREGRQEDFNALSMLLRELSKLEAQQAQAAPQGGDNPPPPSSPPPEAGGAPAGAPPQ